MIEHWIIRHRETGEEQRVQCAGGQPPYDLEIFEIAKLPRELGEDEAWQWEAAAIVSRFTPDEAAERMWARAKAYRDGVRFYETVPVAGVIPDEIVMVECKGKSRTKVTDFAQAAGWALQAGLPYSLNFRDGSMPNREFTSDARQTIAFKAAVTIRDGLDHLACKAIGETIFGALEAGATADAILTIDITAGYSDEPISPPMPPAQES